MCIQIFEDVLLNMLCNQALIRMLTMHTHAYLEVCLSLLLLCYFLTPILFSADPFPDDMLPDKSGARKHRKKGKPVDFTYHKWAHMGVPMLISAGDDAKLFAYSVQDFTKFSPHDICPAPQRVPMQMVHKSVFNQTSLLLVQGISDLDILRLNVSTDSSGRASTKPLVRVKSRDSRKIICSAISNTGSLFGYSDQIGLSLFELKKNEIAKSPWSVSRRRLPTLPFAHSMIFSSDCSRLILAGHDRRIYVRAPTQLCYELFVLSEYTL